MSDQPSKPASPGWARPATPGANTGARIDINDTPANAVLKLVGNDRAAAEACIAMVKAVETADPDAAFGPFTPLLILEQMELRGARIGQFYARVCGGDVVTALGVLHAVRLKLVPADVVMRATDGRGRLDVGPLVDLVRGRLTRFGR